jgi:hypothetical protein
MVSETKRSMVGPRSTYRVTAGSSITTATTCQKMLVVVCLCSLLAGQTAAMSIHRRHSSSLSSSSGEMTDARDITSSLRSDDVILSLLGSSEEEVCTLSKVSTFI